MLHFVDHFGPEDIPALVISHGLYGSARNWSLIAKRLSQSRRVIVVDQRNHGASPWFETNSYEDMAADLAEVVDFIGGPCDIVGHSMGGKAAMVLALTHPNLIDRLCIADIAPVRYVHDQSQFLRAMKAVDLSQIKSRSDVRVQLLRSVGDELLASFFAQSVDVEGKRWRLNLDVLELAMPKILSFPEICATFQGTTLFLSGSKSHYVTSNMRELIKAFFPSAVFAKIPRAGHWLHADRPRAFEEVLKVFFGHRK